MASTITKHILIVDDRINWRRVLRVLLEGDGHQVSEAESLQEAQKLLTQPESSFDLAVLDVRLVDEESMNVQGLELLQIIKNQKPLMKTIILTGYPDSIKGEIDADTMLLKVPEGGTFDTGGFKTTVRNLLT